MQTLNQTKNKDLECPVPHKQRNKLVLWFKRIGIFGFLFFLVKGLLWLIVPYLIAKGYFDWVADLFR